MPDIKLRNYRELKRLMQRKGKTCCLYTEKVFAFAAQSLPVACVARSLLPATPDWGELGPSLTDKGETRGDLE
jgi:hypothetical protein